MRVVFCLAAQTLDWLSYNEKRSQEPLRPLSSQNCYACTPNRPSLKLTVEKNASEKVARHFI